MKYSLTEAQWTLNQIMSLDDKSQASVARELGVRPQTLTAFKKGKTVSTPIFNGLKKILESYKRYMVEIYEQYNGLMGYVFEVYGQKHINKIHENFKKGGVEPLYSKIYKRITSPVVRKHDRLITTLKEDLDLIFINRVDFLSNMVDKIKSVKIKQALGEELGLIYD